MAVFHGGLKCVQSIRVVSYLLFNIVLSDNKVTESNKNQKKRKWDVGPNCVPVGT